MIIQCIGCWKIGKILLEAILGAWFPKSNISIQTKSRESGDRILREYWVKLGLNPAADIIFLLLKPQQIGDVDFSWFSKNALVFSVLAGTSIQTIQKYTGIMNVLRCMPNIAIGVNRGILGYIYSGAITTEQKEFLDQYIFPLWKVIEVYDENHIDVITAIAWSGPAYYFFLTNILALTAEQLWLSPEVSKLLARETFFWGAYYAEYTGESIAQLIEKIASKWGTTEAALKKFEIDELPNIVSRGVKEAYMRAQELSNSSMWAK